jgi:hypothetical protein
MASLKIYKALTISVLTRPLPGELFMKTPKPIHYLLVLLLACGTTFAKQTNDEKKESSEAQEKEQERKEEEERKEKQRKAEEEIKQAFPYSFNDIRDNLVIVEHENGTGSGFIAKMGEHYYIFTNQHVIFGASKIRFKSVSGKQLHPKKVELSASRDIARLLLDTDEGFAVSGNIIMDSPIGVFGNSDGAGVATELYGKINGIGADLVEVSADFVSGNSGSPVLNHDKEVIGIASYVRFSGNNRSKKGTKFENKTRRFCYRIADSRWVSVNWGKYNKKYGAPYAENEQLLRSLETIYNDWDGDVSNRIQLGIDSNRHILSWAETHNEMTSKYRGQSKFRSECAKSLETLGGLCKGASLTTAKLLASEEKYLTDFLKDGFKRQANTFHAYEDLNLYISSLMRR